MKNGRAVTFENNHKRKIIGFESIGNAHIITNNVSLVEGLKHNLLSVS